MKRIQVLGGLAVLAVGVGVALAQAPANMSFFVTSANPGKGGNLGGLTGADAHCQSLAAAVGAGGKTWHAYLSTDTVNAKDRIGRGPWQNAKGEVIAQNVADLHSANNKISAATALTEKGTAPNYLGGTPPAPLAQPLQHDILTGTNEDGTSSGLDVQQLDGRRRRHGDAGSRGPPRPQSGRQFLERHSSVAGLLDGEARADGRRRHVLLLRDELIFLSLRGVPFGCERHALASHERATRDQSIRSRLKRPTYAALSST